MIWWLGSFPTTSARSGRTEPPGRHGNQLEKTQARATVHHLRWGYLLRDLHDERKPFWKLMAKETVEGERVTVARFGRRLAMLRTAFDGAPASRSSSTTSPCSPQAPPWVNCFGRRWIELMRRLSSCARVWVLRDKIRWVQAAIYRASWSYS
jgi:hypothetical protein